jgi:hypothetical protein
MLPLPKNIARTISLFHGRKWLVPVLYDWFERSEDRFFILTGGPGTGKSSFIAWLAGELLVREPFTLGHGD